MSGTSGRYGDDARCSARRPLPGSGSRYAHGLGHEGNVVKLCGLDERLGHLSVRGVASIRLMGGALGIERDLHLRADKPLSAYATAGPGRRPHRQLTLQTPRRGIPPSKPAS